MSLLKANSVQIGQSATATQNFTLSVPSSPNGTIKLARGNSGSTTADVLSVDASGNVTTTLADGSVKFSQLSTSATEADNVAKRTAKAWVNFNGTGTVAIRSSFNVSSITDSGVGFYLMNFTTAMSDSNYAAVYSTDDPVNGQHVVSYIAGYGATTFSSTQIGLSSHSATNGNASADPTRACVIVFA
jgi:hypothetical protein